jgi:hypothetical protein
VQERSSGGSFYLGYVNSRDDTERPGPGFSPGSRGPAAGDDVLELGRRQLPVLHRRPPVAVVLAVAGLLVGLVAGYAAGRHAGNSAAALSRSRAASSPAAPSAAGAFALTQAGRQCSAQIGPALQLGVQVTNPSATGVLLRRVKVVLPLGGLKELSQAWGPCGELPTGSQAPDNTVPAGASAWFTVTFKVLVKCPGPLPVQFTLYYDQLGREATIQLPGFADLGHVPFASCPVN